MNMNDKYDLSHLHWTLAGFIPEYWRIKNCMEIGIASDAEISSIPAPVPGSVQKALLDAEIIPDWNVGMNYRLCEWVENRHWIYETDLPDEWFSDKGDYYLNCLGLDYCGCVRLNGNEIYRFANAHVPHVIRLSEHLQASGNKLQIIFECSPRWQGQFGRTSSFTEPKPRFNYSWDWTVRLVQIGIWDDIFIERVNTPKLLDVKIHADANVANNCGELTITGRVSESESLTVKAELVDQGKIIHSQTLSAEQFNSDGLHWNYLPIQFWWPNGMGEQKRYSLNIELVREYTSLDSIQRNIGFKYITWQPCENAPQHADPWICNVNGKAMFMFGVNWTPIRTNFADLTVGDYEKRLNVYKNLNMNVLRVWGGGFLEKECFYELCDTLGLLVWQEFPLSSSGHENYPPDDPESMDVFCDIAKSYIARRHHHVSLLLWSGGNELADDKHGIKTPWYPPIDISHPLIQRFADIVNAEDKGRRFIVTSPSGPRGHNSNPADVGKGVHWDVHGPWHVQDNFDEYIEYWETDDAMLHSETGCSAPSSAELIRAYRGDCDDFPASFDNPLWKRNSWWIEWDKFIQENNRKPANLEEYVQWGQQRQANALSVAVSCCRKHFPRCGGILIWMGHDCFPCTANTSIIDYEGNPKPAALKIAEIIHKANCT